MWNGASMERSRSPLKAVCDAGPIIHLDEIGVLYLIEDFQEILLCPAVIDEVQTKRPNLFAKISPPFVGFRGRCSQSSQLLLFTSAALSSYGHRNS